MMHLRGKIALNTIIHTVGKFGASGIGVVIVGILTRYLGVEGYGAYTTVFAYLFFFAIVSDLGLYVVTVNELKRTKFGEVRFFNNVFTLRLVSALFLMLAASGLVWLFPYALNIKIGVAIAAGSIFLNLIDQLVVAFFQTRINMKRVAVAEVVGKSIILVLTLLVVYLGGSLGWVLAVVGLGFGANLGINLFYLRRWLKLKLAVEREVWKEILIKSWPIAVTSVFSLIYFKADTLFLSLLPANPLYAISRNAAVGIYGAPYKILEVLIAWPAIFMGLVSPFLASAWAAKKLDSFREIWRKAFLTIMTLAAPMIIGGVILAEKLMVFVAGPAFSRSAAVFQILIFAVGIIFVTHLTTYAIIAVGKQKQMIKFYALAAVLAVAGYLALIPRYSYLAAAGVTVGVEGFMLAATLGWLIKYKLIKIDWIGLAKIMFSAAIMGGGLALVSEGNVIVAAALGGIIYFGILWLSGGLGRGNKKLEIRN